MAAEDFAFAGVEGSNFFEKESYDITNIINRIEDIMLWALITLKLY